MKKGIKIKKDITVCFSNILFLVIFTNNSSYKMTWAFLGINRFILNTLRF